MHLSPGCDEVVGTQCTSTGSIIIHEVRAMCRAPLASAVAGRAPRLCRRASCAQCWTDGRLIRSSFASGLRRQQ